MPIYEYRCSSCGHELETLQKLSDAPLRACPACHRDSLVKQVSAAGFQLKGSGWYATDFKGGAKPAAKNGDAAKANSDTKTETASETKSESKSERATPASTGTAAPAAPATDK